MALTILKNDGVPHWEGLIIPYMKWKIKFMFPTTNLFFLIGQPGGYVCLNFCRSVPQIGSRTKCSSKSTDSIWTKRSVNLGLSANKTILGDSEQHNIYHQHWHRLNKIFLYVIVCISTAIFIQYIKLSTYLHVGKYKYITYILHICRQLLHFMTCNSIRKLMRDMDVSIMRGMGEK